MQNLLPLGRIDHIPLLLEIKRNPSVWNRQTMRTQDPTSPHHGLDDIWVRYNKNSACYDAVEARKEHESVWYPEADSLPSVRDMAFQIMSMVRGERLGGILITRIPPGRVCRPHTDCGWHAEYYDKYAVQLESHQDQAFCFAEGRYGAAPGEIYWFNNLVEHWVTNNSAVDRITAIFCIRSERRT
jgi:hypothetical protein